MALVGARGGLQGRSGGSAGEVRGGLQGRSGLTLSHLLPLGLGARDRHGSRREIPLLNGGTGFGFQSEIHTLMPRTCGSGRGMLLAWLEKGLKDAKALGEQEAHRK